MDLAEIEFRWEEFAHRNDLDYTDLDTIKEFVDGLILDNIMQADPDLSDVLSASPQVYLHGGLMFLHEQAEDDEALARERTLFRQALDGYKLGHSVRNTPAGAKMTLPYNPGG